MAYSSAVLSRRSASFLADRALLPFVSAWISHAPGAMAWQRTDGTRETENVFLSLHVIFKTQATGVYIVTFLLEKCSCLLKLLSTSVHWFVLSE